MKLIKVMGVMMIIAGFVFIGMSAYSWINGGAPEAGVTTWAFVFFCVGAVFIGVIEECEE